MTSVFESEDPQVPEPGTTEDLGVSPETTESDPTDEKEAGPSLEEQITSAVQEQALVLQEKYETDLNGLRSSLDQRYAEATKGWEQREKDYKEKVFDLETAGMDENELLKHKYNLASEQITVLEETISGNQTKIRELTTIDGYIRFFEDNGISRKNLVLDRGLDVAIQSGWEAMSAKIKDLEAQQQGEAPSSEVPPETPPEAPGAPEVLTDQGGIPTGRTWPELIKQYGSQEEVYRLVQEQLLDPSIIPVEPETP